MGYRRNGKKVSAYGHSMFVDESKADEIDAAYAGQKWFFSGECAVNVESLPIAATWQSDKDDDFDACMSNIGEHERNLSADEVSASFNPASIIDDAIGFDNISLLGWFWERVLEPAGIDAVMTHDGAVVFNADLIAAC